jgi:drug/metabolite transporter (DMT)-like permease
MIRIDSFRTGAPAAMSKSKVLVAGLAVVVLWASAFPAIRVAAPDLGVIGLSVVRLAVASLSLLAVAPLAHVRLPERRHLPLVVPAAFFGMTAYQLLLDAAELHVPAGTASILVAAAPLVSVAIATLFLGEELTVTRPAAWSRSAEWSPSRWRGRGRP